MPMLSVLKQRLCVVAWAWIWVVGLVLVADQLIKSFVMNQIPYLHGLDFLPGIHLVHVHNLGAALNLLGQGIAWQLYTLLCFEVLGVIFLGYFLSKLRAEQKAAGIGLSLILGGALSNLTDRFLYHYVIDYIDLFMGPWHWPAILNLADIAITFGIILYLCATYHQDASLRS